MIYAAEYFGKPWLASVPPWALLLLLVAASCYWNWRAGLAFALGILVARLSAQFLPQPEVGVIVGYSAVAFIALFFLDSRAAFFLAALSVLAIVRFWVPAFVLVSELVLVVGVIFCGWAGGSGGLFWHDNPRDHRGFGRAMAGPALHQESPAQD